MGGGILQLVMTGEMDTKWLTGNPQISFFKQVYKKHTNFSIETKLVYFDSDLEFGRKTSITIPKKGDLISNIYLEIVLPPLINRPGQTVSYVNSIGNAIIEYVELEIGGEVIVKHTGEWLNIWNQLTITNEKKRSYQNMIGQYGFIDSNTNQNGGKYIIPLNFWFCEDNSLAFPLVALQFHQIKINIKLRELNKLYLSSDGLPPLGNYKIGTDSYVYLDYIYLERIERTALVKREHDLLIKQLQINEFSIPENQTNVKLSLDFNHPITEILWVIQRDDIKNIGPETGNDWFNFSDSLELPFSDSLVDAKFIFNGTDRIEPLSSKYFRLLEPFKRHTSIPDNFVYCYSFALQPELNQPSGNCNFSRIESAEIMLTLKPNLPKLNLRFYGLNLNILTLSAGMAGLRYTN